MISRVKQFLDAAPSALKSANEIYNFARNKYKQIMGVFPDGIDNIALKRGAAEMQDTRNKVVKLDELTPDPRVIQPKGAKVDTMRAHENISGGSGYAQGDTKYNADILAEEIARMRGLIDEGQDATDMNPKEYSKIYDEAYSYLTQLRVLNRKPKTEGIEKLIESGDVTIGTAPKTTKTKPKVDPELQAMEDNKQMFLDFGDRIETDAEIIARMNKQNKEAVERLKKKKEKDLGDKLKDLPDDIDPDAMAMGGRIGMSKGGGLIDLLKFFSKKSPFQAYKDYLASVKRRAQTEPEKLAPELGAVTAGGIFTNRRMKDILEEGNELQKERLLEEFIADLDKDPFYIDRPELKDKAIEQYTETLFGEKRAMGGRIGFEDGGMSRRAFLKLMGGLASIPVFGKFFKAAKPAAKVAEVAKEVTSGVPAYFTELIKKIKLLGTDISETAATTERQKVTQYKGYELTEDLTTGKKEIKIGDAEYGKEEYMIYEPPETIIGKNNKPVQIPAQYDEVTVKPDMDGKMKDVDSGLDSYDEVLEEVRMKKSGGGVAYMLGE
tara:strand:+ start:121 stop:1773 length:1653 start_codon:yes stop_codon:yes gene_type:complete